MRLLLSGLRQNFGFRVFADLPNEEFGADLSWPSWPQPCYRRRVYIPGFSDFRNPGYMTAINGNRKTKQKII
jgi:hypothetical protein